MKKLLLVALAGATFAGTPTQAVNKFRAMKCAIPRFQKRLRCTPQEIQTGRRWLAGTSAAAASAALGGLIAGGVKAAEIQRAKQSPIAAQISGAQAEALLLSNKIKGALSQTNLSLLKTAAQSIIDNPAIVNSLTDQDLQEISTLALNKPLVFQNFVSYLELFSINKDWQDVERGFQSILQASDQ